MPTARIHDADLFYRDEGRGAETVLLLHGYLMTEAVWDWQAEALVAAGYRVVRPDWRGQGQSAVAADGYDPWDLAADALALMDHLGIERAHVVGHSMGGYAAPAAASSTATASRSSSSTSTSPASWSRASTTCRTRRRRGAAMPRASRTRASSRCLAWDTRRRPKRLRPSPPSSSTGFAAMPDLDLPRDVRKGEELDVPALAAWLRETLGIDETPTVHQYPSGFSNLTYLLDLGGREFVLRRPPMGQHVRGGHDMGREFRLLTALAGHVPVPEALGFEPTDGVLGAPFYVMEHVPGTVLRASDAEPPDAAAMARVADAFVETLAGLHALAPETVGLGDLGNPDGYVGRQVAGWARRYASAATDAIPDLDRAFAWMDANGPAESGVAVIHNDFKYDNLVLDPETLGIRAILDWELATVGDPLMDLGSTLGYWAEATDPPALRAAALSPTWWPGNPTREGLVAMYEARTGRRVEHAPFYTVYGLTKLAVIAQQIYQRWTLGTTRDPRFRSLIHVVRACGEAATRVIDTGQISG